MKAGEKISFTYTGSPQEIVLDKGIYQLEVWGAEGGGYRLSGNSSSGDGGRGGYSKGTVTINRKQSLYVYVGGHGISATNTIAEGGWNGGGCAWASTPAEPANGGGGATDIRLIGGNWDNSEGLLSRIIVAGGGGGGGEDSEETGGYGGGLVGGSNFGANQTGTSGGGAFGKGAHTPRDGGGGGGGWFGGGTLGGSQNRPTSNDSGDVNGGSGGSGYALNESSDKPEGYMPTSEHFLTDTQLLSGSQSIPTQDSSSTQTGNIGNGYAVITCIKSSGWNARCKVNGEIKNVSSMKIKVNGVWKNVTGIKSKINGVWE